ncbi:MAG: hypothetical protein ABW019_03845, partial [Chitinophagaceae bacterium]
MINTEQAALWQRIQEFHPDDPADRVKFSDKLALQNNWSPAYTARVIEEYKKFVFLCCISPTGAAPSQIVDEAWHLHLTYTHNYWKVFCPQVLGRELHHHPSKGGPAEQQRHAGWYAQTLELYRSTFDEPAPEDIWPAPVVPAAAPLPESVLTGERPASYLKYLCLLLGAFVIPLFFGAVHPFQLDGPSFLVFFAGLGVAGLVYLYVVYQHNKEIAESVLKSRYDFSAGLYQVTRYAYDMDRSLQTAVVDLIDRNVLRMHQEPGVFTFHPSAYQPVAAGKNPLIANLLKQYSEEEVVMYGSLRRAYDAALTEHPGLAQSLATLDKKYTPGYALIVLIGLVCIARIMQALVNDRPFLFLVIMTGLFIVLFYYCYKWAHPLTIFRKILAAESRDTLSAGTGSSITHQFAFTGMAALTAAYMYGGLVDTFRDRTRNTGDGGASGGGCGSSGCGSGG